MAGELTNLGIENMGHDEITWDGHAVWSCPEECKEHHNLQPNIPYLDAIAPIWILRDELQ